MPLIHILALLQGVAAISTTAAIRINQLGYLPDAPKVAVFCSVAPIEIGDFIVTEAAGKKILQRPAAIAKSFGPCVAN
ncbi:MAG TPA: cellulase N-terminal Ig-like domain-containing protein, partial [Gemmatimonadaceae bacterium]|nr:cellulase N-terminal Ig-like domain-containing protein [Gemmatimonadaceae bacterium]